MHQHNFASRTYDALSLPLAQQTADREQRRARQLGEFSTRERNLDAAIDSPSDLLYQPN